MTVREFAERFMLNLPFEPTPQQTTLVAALSRFVGGEPPGRAAFVLNGYAGTGKTSVVSALVRTLREIGAPTVLLAPTGRAAKVFSSMAGQAAYTIHRRIYRHTVTGAVSMNVNSLSHAIFIVDEASMIGDEPGHATGASLLDDLLEFVYSGDNCRLILLGDTAQLPPVGLSVSPALDVMRLKQAGLRVSRAQMTSVVRQDSNSGILLNATHLRRQMERPPLPKPRFKVRGLDDIKVVEGHELADEVATAYARDGVENTILITRSNRAATAANMTIRSSVLYSEEELCRGERLLVVKNNYLWTKPSEGLDFVANGDMATLTAIHSTEQLHGFRFADVTLMLTHLDLEIDCKIVLDALVSDTPALPPESFARLWESRLAALPLDWTKSQKMRALKTDPYLNALQVKYAYAVTCHKSQGGQWENVMVDMSGLTMPADAPDEAEAAMLTMYRWLYTSFTRATRRLYLINPPEESLH